MVNLTWEYRFWHMTFVLSLIFAGIAIRFTPVQAQEDSNQLFLPMMVSGGPTEFSQIDGPFEGVTAAGSCYGSNFWASTHYDYKVGAYKTDRISVSDHGGSHCNDLNIWANTIYPASGCIRYVVYVYDGKNNYKRNSGLQTVCEGGKWKVLTYGLDDSDSYQIDFFNGNPSHILLAD